MELKSCSRSCRQQSGKTTSYCCKVILFYCFIGLHYFKAALKLYHELSVHSKVLCNGLLEFFFLPNVGAKLCSGNNKIRPCRLLAEGAVLHKDQPNR